MSGLPCGVARDVPPPPGQERRRRSPGWRRGPRQADRQARQQREANQGTRRRGCEPGPPLTSSREAQQASPRSAGRTPATDFRLELPRAEQTVATLEAGPARLSHGTAQVRGAGPPCHDTLARPRRATGEDPPRNSGRNTRVEYEQGRTTLSRTGGKPPGVDGSHGSVRGETYKIDGLEQCCNDALPATFRTGARDDDKTVEIGPQLGRCCKPELRQTGHCAPVPQRRRAR
jgi:hypothetical protein